jgi:hypothetical protein
MSFYDYVFSLLGIVFVYFKLTGGITWGWWWVIMPFIVIIIFSIIKTTDVLLGRLFFPKNRS